MPAVHYGVEQIGQLLALLVPHEQGMASNAIGTRRTGLVLPILTIRGWHLLRNFASTFLRYPLIALQEEVSGDTPSTL